MSVYVRERKRTLLSLAGNPGRLHLGACPGSYTATLGTRAKSPRKLLPVANHGHRSPMDPNGILN